MHNSVLFYLMLSKMSIAHKNFLVQGKGNQLHLVQEARVDPSTLWNICEKHSQKVVC